jgi:hypothetical protein
MKAEKKRVGTKTQIKAMKEKDRHVSLIVTALLLAALILFSGFYVYTTLFAPPEEGNLPSPTLQFKPANNSFGLKAMIVDQLSLTIPNQTFVQTAASILTKAGYSVDYYSGEKVNVEFYRNLAAGESNLIILRAHSALEANKAGQLLGSVDLFSSEPYSTTEYVSEQLTSQLSDCMFLAGGPTYFGISPQFFQESMKGTFKNAMIILMGCDGLTYTALAQAMVQKGARVVIGWNGPVDAGHTDQATVNLLQHLTLEKQTVEQAISSTMSEVGPDPQHKSELSYYPS